MKTINPKYSKSEIEDFDHGKRYLGALCKWGHEWKGTGMSVRAKNSHRACILCKNIQRKEYYHRHKEHMSEYAKKYREENKAKLNESEKKRYKNKDKDKRKASYNAYAKRHRKKINERSRAYIATLPDSYIRHRIAATTHFAPSEVPQALIHLKRQQLIMHRLLMESKNELTRTRN